jgi:hypothetical protein
METHRLHLASEDRAVVWARASDVMTLKQAIEFYTALIRKVPHLAQPHAARGVARSEVSQTARIGNSLADFERAVRLETQNPEYRLLRASSWLDRGEVARTLADLDEAVGLSPRDACV